MKIEWQDLPLLGYGYFAKVVFKCWTKNIANWSGCWYVASNIWYFFFLMRNDRVLVEKMNVLFKLLAFMKRRGKNHPPPFDPFWIGTIHILRQQKDWVGGVKKWLFSTTVSIVFILHSGWMIKGPKMC